MAVRIFLHAWRMIFQNLKDVWKISMPVIVVALLAATLFGTVMASGISGYEVDALTASIYFIPLVIAYIIALLWTAVAWHRYCLLAEYPGGIFPAFNGGRVLSYVGHSLLLMLVFLVLGGALSALLYVLTGAANVGLIAGLLMAVGIFALAVIFLRLGIVLPAAAIGEPIGIGQAWKATESLTKNIILLIFLLMLFGLGLGIVSAILGAIHPVLGVLGDAIIGLLQMLMNLSILTTLYGIAIQGRDID